MNDDRKKRVKKSPRRRGVIAPLLAILSVPLMGMLAFSIDYGYLEVMGSELQRTADAAVLSAAIDLVPNPDGTQNLQQARDRVVEYVQANLSNSPAGDSSFIVLDADIQTGRYDRSTINDTSQPVVLFDSGLHDAVRVTLRRDATANGPIKLFFARFLGVNEQPMEVTATAVLRRAYGLQEGVYILPFAIPVDFWDGLAPGEVFRVWSDSKLTDEYDNQVNVLDPDGNEIPGNWGTVDIGLLNNSTRNREDQTLLGLAQEDLNALDADGRILGTGELRAPVWLEADTGLASGMKDVITGINGQDRVIPLYDYTNGDIGGSGNNGEFHIVAWGVIEVSGSRWNGNQNTWVEGFKDYTFDGALKPIEDLTYEPNGDIDGMVGNAFAAPVLVR